MKTKLDHSAIKDVSEETFNKALDIINSNTDPQWNSTDFGYFIIGVTGKHQVYYTFWKYSPKMAKFGKALNYMCNLSTDILTAANKAKSYSGRCPVEFEDYETLIGLQGAPADILGFGKYRGETIGEIYIKDMNYLIWLNKTFQDPKNYPRNKKQIEQQQLVKTLVDEYFLAMTEKNKENETKEYFQIGQKFIGEVNILNIREDKWSDGIIVRCEDDKYRFMFKLSLKYVCELIDEIYTIPQYTDGNFELQKEVIQKLKSMKTMNIRGKAKYNNEIVGKKWTRLSNVSVDEIS